MRKEQGFRWKNMNIGTCYYPEHWPEELWADDLDRMSAAGIETIRIAEFAWNMFEPTEGNFTYAFFDRFLDLCEKKGMKVIFCTPTATPPAWLTVKYPETLNTRADGVPYRHGLRRHYTYNSPIYRELTARLVENIAVHYAKRPCIIGWQIDNELNCETDEFYSAGDNAAFRVFLREKYSTLDKLNDAWGTVFWNQTYTDWDEIRVPGITTSGHVNPHQTLDYYRFISDSTVSFCRLQCDIIRKHLKPGDFITTNGKFANLDNHRMTDEALDVYTFDSYPNFAFALDAKPCRQGEMDDRRWSDRLNDIRSICPHFGIMEQQSGAGGWNTDMEAPQPKPGRMMLWAMQSVAHGADFVSFFRWRTAAMGTEIYWHGLLDYDNRDNRRISELKKFRDRIKAIEETVGAEYCEAFGVIRDYDNIFDARLDKWHSRLITPSEDAIFKASETTHTPMGYIYLLDSTEAAELSKYPVLFCPHALIMTEERVTLLKEYVAQGGTLIIGARTGLKDITGKCPMHVMPGGLSDITGTNVRESTFIGPEDIPQQMNMNGKILPTGVYADILEVNAGSSAKVLAVYEHDYYAGAPALIENTYGRGRVLHFGGTFTVETSKALLSLTGVISPYSDTVDASDDVEINVKEKDGRAYLFVLNFNNSARSFTLKIHAVDLDNMLEAYGEIMLAPFETKVYRLK